jgi:hypothetical protein
VQLRGKARKKYPRFAPKTGSTLKRPVAYPSVEHLKGTSLGLLANIRLVWKSLPGTNTPVCCDLTKKCFALHLVPDPKEIKPFFLLQAPFKK